MLFYNEYDMGSLHTIFSFCSRIELCKKKTYGVYNFPIATSCIFYVCGWFYKLWNFRIALISYIVAEINMTYTDTLDTICSSIYLSSQSQDESQII